jgi:hypothetical protein
MYTQLQSALDSCNTHQEVDIAAVAARKNLLPDPWATDPESQSHRIKLGDMSRLAHLRIVEAREAREALEAEQHELAELESMGSMEPKVIRYWFAKQGKPISPSGSVSKANQNKYRVAHDMVPV